MYSKEEIEKKRQQALLRQKQKMDKSTNFGNSSISKNYTNNYTNQNILPNSGSSTSNNVNNYLNKNLTPPSNAVKNFTNRYSQNKTPSTFKQQSSSNRFNPISNVNKFYGNLKSCEVSCSMISNIRFAVDMSIYHPPLIELFKTIPTKLYDTKTKIWNFHINDYDLLHEKIVSMNNEVMFKGLPSFLIKTFRNLLLSEKVPKPPIDLSQIDASLTGSLYPFQKEGIEYGISKGGRCFIADDMGLGKTRQALGIAHYYKKDWPLLIITPSSVKYQWSEAIIENLSSVPVQSIQHIVTTKDFIEKGQITILSYDLLVRRIDEIVARKFGVIICDESHYLKSAKTQRTKAVQRLSGNAKRIILLTGTPALSRPIELHPQIKLLMPSFMSYQDYGFRYCAGVQTSFGWDFTGSSNLKELEILLKASCLIRRLKKDVMTQLPSKIRQKIILDPYLIKTATKEMKAASKKMQESEKGTQNHNALLQYYHESSIAKEKAVCNYIADLIENQQKFLVFAHHQNMLDAISNLLTSKKILFIRIDGKTKAEQRKYFVDKFQQDEEILVAVLSITAANAGITMTAAQLVVFAELSWNPGILCQAEDRVHRIGQTENVVIRYLLANSTVDDYLWPAIQKKIDILNEVGLDQHFDLNGADMEKQTLHKQQTLDDLFETSQDEKPLNSSNIDAAGNVNLCKSSDSLKDLLDVDDGAFDDIDLDNFT